MNWDFSTFRKSILESIILFYGFSILMGIAAQYMDRIPPSELTEYLLTVLGFAGLVLYANRVLGWTLPRPIFLIISGGASIFAVTHFPDDATKFALVALAAFIVCATLAISMLFVECLSAVQARARANQVRREE